MNQQFSKGITKRARLPVKSCPEIPSDKGKWEAPAFVNKHSFVSGNNPVAPGGWTEVWEEGSHQLSVDEGSDDERKEYRYRWR